MNVLRVPAYRGILFNVAISSNAFQCQCVDGYTGQLCNTEINECASNPCVAGHFTQCHDLVAAFDCDCAVWLCGHAM